jgi:hypothetical protein
MSKLKIILIGCFLIIVVVLGINYLLLQKHMTYILENDKRNEGIKVFVHYKWFVNPTELKYDLRNISGKTSALDVNRVMFQFSEKIKDKKFNKVYLSYRGDDKLYLEGDYFQNMGKEYKFQNPIYTLRTLPENVYTLDGQHKYGVWEGGLFGVASKQMEDLNSFTQDWYLSDYVKELK